MDHSLSNESKVQSTRVFNEENHSEVNSENHAMPSCKKPQDGSNIVSAMHTMGIKGPEESAKPIEVATNINISSYTDSTGVDLQEFIINILEKNPRDRIMLLKIEQDLMNFILDQSHPFLKFGPMGSYQRMLVHRVSAFFGMDHNVDKTGHCVVVNKTLRTRIPDFKFCQYVPAGDKMHDLGGNKTYILQRSNQGMYANSSVDSNCSGNPNGVYDRRSKTLGERQTEYQQAKDRIFKTPITTAPSPHANVPISNNNGNFYWQQPISQNSVPLMTKKCYSQSQSPIMEKANCQHSVMPPGMIALPTSHHVMLTPSSVNNTLNDSSTSQWIAQQRVVSSPPVSSQALFTHTSPPQQMPLASSPPAYGARPQILWKPDMANPTQVTWSNNTRPFLYTSDSRQNVGLRQWSYPPLTNAVNSQPITMPQRILQNSISLPNAYGQYFVHGNPIAFQPPSSFQPTNPYVGQSTQYYFDQAQQMQADLFQQQQQQQQQQQSLTGNSLGLHYKLSSEYSDYI